jgi:hypothetical protein
MNDKRVMRAGYMSALISPNKAELIHHQSPRVVVAWLGLHRSLVEYDRAVDMLAVILFLNF